MSSLVKLFIAMIALIAPINNLVESALSSAIDLDKILDIVQQEQLSSIVNNPHRAERSQDSSDSDSESDDYFSYIEDSDKTESNRYARLRKERIIDLIDKVAHEKTNRLVNDVRNIRNIRKERPDYRQNNNENRIEDHGNVQAQVLEHLLSKSFNEEDRKRKLRAPRPKKRLTPNRLTGSISRNDIKDYDRNVASGLQDYSKVYIVLNPQAVRNSKNKSSLNDMISKILSLSSQNSKSDRQGKKKPRRYKGFLVNDGQSRRSRRESKEVYVPKDTVEHSPKRFRSGGNAGGHTAIPYIRHRGNVYERDD